MKYLAILALITLGFSACNQPSGTESTHANPPAGTSGTDRPAQPDNTGVNTRDRNANAKTPIDQNENQADIDVTAKIRKQVVDTKMSVDAQNVKIITQDGKVTLRGPVKSADEKKRIEDIAHAVAGADKVDSQLEVAK